VQVSTTLSLTSGNGSSETMYDGLGLGSILLFLAWPWLNAEVSTSALTVMARVS